MLYAVCLCLCSFFDGGLGAEGVERISKLFNPSGIAVIALTGEVGIEYVELQKGKEKHRVFCGYTLEVPTDSGTAKESSSKTYLLVTTDKVTEQVLEKFVNKQVTLQGIVGNRSHQTYFYIVGSEKK